MTTTAARPEDWNQQDISKQDQWLLKYKDLELYMIKNPLAHPATEANAQVYIWCFGNRVVGEFQDFCGKLKGVQVFETMMGSHAYNVTWVQSGWTSYEGHGFLKDLHSDPKGDGISLEKLNHCLPLRAQSHRPSPTQPWQRKSKLSMMLWYSIAIRDFDSATGYIFSVATQSAAGNDIPATTILAIYCKLMALMVLE